VYYRSANCVGQAGTNRFEPCTLVSMGNLRSSLYRAARDLGDAQAASRGPSALGRRVARKAVYRAEGKATRRIFRKFGL
jgi:hypothetical protein